MATNEADDQPAGPARAEVVRQFIAQATDTAGTGVSLRVWAILAGLGIVVAVAVFPVNIFGTVLLVALALTLGSRSRGR